MNKEKEENLASWTEFMYQSDIQIKSQERRECSGASYGSARVSLHISQ